MKKIWTWLRGETVFCIALAAALVSMLATAPDAGYAAYVDWDVLMLLFALMGVVAGLRRCGVMDALSGALVKRAGNTRSLCTGLTLACFFSSMLLTNDVALITFVPLASALLSGPQLMLTVALQTIAANLGSMATPIGNPQNLYLYAAFDMPMGVFLRAVLPLTGASLVLVLLSCLLVRPEALLQKQGDKPAAVDRRALGLYALAFALCLLSVLKVVPKWSCCAVVILIACLHDRTLLKEIDYALLATFVCFFVFVGNLGRIEAVSRWLGGLIAGRELEVGILSSQVISNVPAALMLSGFTTDAAALLRGVDLGGLGTLVASLASLISFKLYVKTPGAQAGRYLAVFTALNAAFLAVLYLLAKLGL